MNKLKVHPLEEEADRIVQGLGGDLATMKRVMATGTTYDFVFGANKESGVDTCLVLPVYVPGRALNILRLEFIVGEVEANDVGRILLAVTLDMDLQQYNALRVVPRAKNDDRTYQIILQSVVGVDLVSEGFISSTLLVGLELTEQYKTRFFQSQSKAA